MANPIITITVTNVGDQVSENVTITTGGATQHIKDTIPTGTVTDREINCAIDTSQLKLILITCDKNVTLEANSGSAADFTLTISADKPFLWYSGCGITNPITADVTKFYATASGSGTGDLHILVDQDPTP